MIGKKDESVHEKYFVKIPNEWNNEKLEEKWLKLFRIKQEANIAIEEKRSNKDIGSGLDADTSILANEKNYDLLKKIDLAEYFITSKAKIEKSTEYDLRIKVTRAKGNKCPRCWKILESKCLRCEDMANEIK